MSLFKPGIFSYRQRYKRTIDVFFLHSETNMLWVKDVETMLIRHNIICWYPEKNFISGLSVEDNIVRCTKNSSCIAVLLSNDLVSDIFYRKQLSLSMRIQMADQRQTIIPLNLNLTSPIPDCLCDLVSLDVSQEAELWFQRFFNAVEYFVEDDNKQITDILKNISPLQQLAIANYCISNHSKIATDVLNYFGIKINSLNGDFFFSDSNTNHFQHLYKSGNLFYADIEIPSHVIGYCTNVQTGCDLVSAVADVIVRCHGYRQDIYRVVRLTFANAWNRNVFVYRVYKPKCELNLKSHSYKLIDDLKEAENIDSEQVDSLIKFVTPAQTVESMDMNLLSNHIANIHNLCSVVGAA